MRDYQLSKGAIGKIKYEASRDRLKEFFKGFFHSLIFGVVFLLCLYGCEVKIGDGIIKVKMNGLIPVIEDVLK